MRRQYRNLQDVDLQQFESNANWDHGNSILYQMVQDNFCHDKKEQVLTKVLFIGRIYAAALERGEKPEDRQNADFYVEQIWPCFQKMDIDHRLETLKGRDLNDDETIAGALYLHGYMVNCLFGLKELNKRSFVSKYLHFHLPDIFFLYDTRAVSAIKKFEPPATKSVKTLLKPGMDEEYASFFLRCINLRHRILSQRGIYFPPRSLDNLLLYS